MRLPAAFVFLSPLLVDIFFTLCSEMLLVLLPVVCCSHNVLYYRIKPTNCNYIINGFIHAGERSVVWRSNMSGQSTCMCFSSSSGHFPPSSSACSHTAAATLISCTKKLNNKTYSHDDRTIYVSRCSSKLVARWPSMLLLLLIPTPAMTEKQNETLIGLYFNSHLKWYHAETRKTSRIKRHICMWIAGAKGSPSQKEQQQ